MFEVGKKYRHNLTHFTYTCIAVHHGMAWLRTIFPNGDTSDSFATWMHNWSEYKEPMKVSGWINIYAPHEATSRRTFYQTKKLADFYAGSNRIDCIYVSGESGKNPNV